MRVTYRLGRDLLLWSNYGLIESAVEIRGPAPAYRERAAIDAQCTAVHSEQLGGNLPGFQLEARLSTYLGSVW